MGTEEGAELLHPQKVEVETGADLKWRDVNEQERVYHFGNGKTFRVENVVRLADTEATHRIETSDGRRYIVIKNFLSIEIKANEWSF